MSAQVYGCNHVAIEVDDMAGTNARASRIARLLDDGTTQMKEFEYDSMFGQVTKASIRLVELFRLHGMLSVAASAASWVKLL